MFFFFQFNREDAEKAVKARLSLAERKLFASYSRRKEPRKKEKPKKGDTEDDENGFEIVKSTETDTKDETTGEDVVKQLNQSKTGDSKHFDRTGTRNYRGKQKSLDGAPSGEGKVGRLIIRNLAFQVRLKVKGQQRKDSMIFDR